MIRLLFQKAMCISALLCFAFSGNAGTNIIPMGGTLTTCAGSVQNFESGFSSAGHMSWAVSGEAEIVNVSGMDVGDLKSANGVPSTSKLQYVFAETCSWTGSLTANFKMANGGTMTYSLTAGISVNLGNSKALAISVHFPQAGNSSVSWTGTAGLCGVFGQRSGSVTVDVKGTSMPATANIYTYGFDPNNLGCTQSVSIGTDWVDGVQYNWKISPSGAIVSGPLNMSSLNISQFTNPGTYTVSLTLSDVCGNIKTYQKAIVVKSPQPELYINSSPAPAIFNPTCIQANGFNMSSEPWIAANIEYEWILPAGWKASEAHSKKETVDGVDVYHYKGVNLRHLSNIRQVSPAASSGTVHLYVTNLCGNNTVVKTMELNIPEGIQVTLPVNIQSCQTTVDINPVVAGGKAPYTVLYTEYMEGYLAKGSMFTTSDDFSNQFIASKYGNSFIRVRVTDAEGCVSTATSNLATLGGYDEEVPDVSGWLSGHLNPNQPAQISSNIVKVPGQNRIYFVHHVSDLNRPIKFYEFDGEKWVIKQAGIMDAASEIENTLTYMRAGGTDLLWYINTNGHLATGVINTVTGQADEKYYFAGIQPREQNYGYHISLHTNGLEFDIYWKDIFATLYKTTLVYDPFVGFIEKPGALTKLAETVYYDLDDEHNRLFYFKKDGGFYYQDLTDPGTEHKLNGIFDGDFVDRVTDIHFDDDGNVYFAANGDIYFAEFNAGQYEGTYKIETDNDPVLTIKSATTGYFAINPASKVIYYAGENGNVYQMYRQPDFETSKAFGIVRATPYTFSDQVQSSLVFTDPHLYYRSQNNQVYNLFYSIPCIPVHLKMAATDPDFINEGQATVVKATSLHSAADVNLSYGTASPNPFGENLTIDVQGEGQGRIELYESTGRKVLTEPYNFTAQTVNTSALTPGIYYCKIFAESGTVAVFKLIKE